MSFAVLACLVLYTVLLFAVMFITGRKADNEAYFTGNRRSPWFAVAFGMIGASLSGVSLLSVPGDVYKTQFTYYGLVIGYLLGYGAIALVLLPLYYKLGLMSIYTYLRQRLGSFSHKSGAFFFILSRLSGSALRMYLTIFVLQEFVFNNFNIPVWATASAFIVIILLYTFKAGIKTVVWTDTLQTSFMLLSLILIIVFLYNGLGGDIKSIWQAIDAKGYTAVFNTNWQEHNFFLKQIVSGAFITIAMTGLDQDMMQKNLSCKTLKDSQRNMFVFSGTLLIVNALLLFLGAMLCVYGEKVGMDLASIKTDRIFPAAALEYLPPAAGLIFILGLIPAAYSSADGTLTALTTVVCVDFLGIDTPSKSDKERTKLRMGVHLIISFLFLIVILTFSRFHNDSLIRIFFNVASYTYGPLLGLYGFGMFTDRKLKYEYFVPAISLLSPAICFALNMYSEYILAGYKFGFELLLLNGLLTFTGLFLISEKSRIPNKSKSSSH